MELPWEKTNNRPGLTLFQFSLLKGLLATMYPRSIRKIGAAINPEPCLPSEIHGSEGQQPVKI
jgi:hypothetical protein